jgi:MFS family permease
MVAVLAFFAMLAAVDKNFLTLVVSDIKADFKLSDVQIGLMIGLAFAASNVAVNLPAGWLADRASRRWVVAGGVALWSAMAASCGFAQSYGQLFLARVGVGLGEGISPPASYSLIRDGVAEQRRGLAYAIFALGTLLGSGVAFVIGGLLLAAIKSLNLTHVPLLGTMPSWQVALVVIGAAGIPITLLAFVFPDPGRGQAARGHRPTFAQAMSIAGRQWRLLLPLLIFSVLHAMITSGLAAWVPAMLGRTYHVASTQFGPILGLILMVGAPISLVTTGVAIDRLGRIGPAVVAIVAAMLLLVAGAVAPHRPSLAAYWPWQVAIVMAAAVYLPVTATLVARVMPPEMTGMTMAFFLFVQAIAGSGFGPLVVALFTERVFAGAPNAINSAISAVSLIFGGVALVAAGAILYASRQSTAAPHP